METVIRRKRMGHVLTWLDLGAVCLLVAAASTFVWCWIRMGSGFQDGGPGRNITDDSILLLSSAAVVVAAVIFLGLHLHQLWSQKD